MDSGIRARRLDCSLCVGGRTLTLASETPAGWPTRIETTSCDGSRCHLAPACTACWIVEFGNALPAASADKHVAGTVLCTLPTLTARMSRCISLAPICFPPVVVYPPTGVGCTMQILGADGLSVFCSIAVSPAEPIRSFSNKVMSATLESKSDGESVPS